MDILLVEDNPADARLVREALAEHEVPASLHWVTSGEEALNYLRPQTMDLASKMPDLVLLDLNLPGLNGHEVLAEIKSDPALKRIPVLVLTSSANPSDVLAAYGDHANAYLIKPEEFDAFLNLVSTVRHHWLDAVLLPSQVG
jgi:CheY-like chemotaxis protein